MAHGNRFMMYLYEHSPHFARNWVISRYSRKRGQVKFGRVFRETLADLSRTQWYDDKHLRDLQDEKVRRLVTYAAEFVPHYRKQFERGGIDHRKIYGAADLHLLPILEKTEVWDHGRTLYSDLYKDRISYELFKSSGTTGKAVEIRVSNEALQMEKAFTWLHRSWGGIELGDITAAFVGFSLVPLSQSSPPFWVHDKSENRVMYSLHHLSRKNLPAYADSLARLKPKMIYGYPTAIYLVAQYINEKNTTGFSPKAIFTASETLLDHQRVEIEKAFGCKVLDWYGATELIANIVQCEAGSYHIKQEYGVVEILKDDGTPASAGEAGILVGTGLNNLAMPLIRYRVGDTAIPRAGSCDCGRGGPLVERITGRVEDVIVTPDRRWFTRLDFVFKGIENVKEAQLVQEKMEEIRIRVVRNDQYNDGNEMAIRTNLRNNLGDEIRIVFEYLDRIPRTASGKFRFVVSKVALESQESRQSGDVVGMAEEENTTL